MFVREEFERAVEALFLELPMFFSIMTELDQQHLDAKAEEMREVRMICQDPSTSDEAVLGAAYGLVSEYIRARWGEVISESYALYTDMSGGESHRHPGAPKA